MLVHMHVDKFEKDLCWGVERQLLSVTPKPRRWGWGCLGVLFPMLPEGNGIKLTWLDLVSPCVCAVRYEQFGGIDVMVDHWLCKRYNYQLPDDLVKSLEDLITQRKHSKCVTNDVYIFSHLDEQGCLCTYKYYSGCGITRMTFGYTTGVWLINFVDQLFLPMGRSVTFLKGQGKGRLLIQFLNFFFFFFYFFCVVTSVMVDFKRQYETWRKSIFYDVIAKVPCWFF
jgi:hypothetical protein